MIRGWLVSWVKSPLVPDDAGAISVSGDPIYPAGNYRLHDPVGTPDRDWLYGVPANFRRPITVSGPINQADLVYITLLNASFEPEPVGWGAVGRGTALGLPARHRRGDRRRRRRDVFVR